ncbi:Dnmt3b [Symbiodinium sp. CCMP2456]|nr:Dnmt3b [Symbiodinium sp. CCMP2456]
MLENVASCSRDFSDAVTQSMLGPPLAVSAASFGWVDRKRLFWCNDGRRSVSQLPALALPKQAKSERGQSGWHVRWQDKKPWPPAVAFSDGFQPFSPANNAASAQDMPCFPVFTRSFRHPPDQGPLSDRATLQRFRDDGCRYPLFCYAEPALLWRGSEWRVPSSSERAQIMGIPPALLHWAPAKQGHEVDDACKEQVRSSLVGNSFHVPSCMLALMVMSVLRNMSGCMPSTPAFIQDFGVLLPPLQATPEVNLALARLQAYWVDTQLRGLKSEPQGPEWRQQRHLQASKQALGVQSGGPGSKLASVPLLPLDVGKDLHMKLSTCLPSPYDVSGEVDDDARFACWIMCTLGPCIRVWRQQQQRAMQTVAKFLQPWDTCLRKLMPADVAKMASARCPAFLSCISALMRWPDTSVGLRFVTGFKCLGVVECPGLFKDVSPDPPAELGLPALLGSHAVRTVDKLECSLPRFPFAKEARSFTAEEIEQGLADGPYSRADLDRQYGRGQWIPMRRFMLPQSSKLRAIDDGRFSGHNMASFLEETIYTTSPDFVAAACGVLLELLLQDENEIPEWALPLFGTDDMSAAYRQIPNSPLEQQAMIIAYFDEDHSELRFAKLRAHPYGLASAVLNFNRVPLLLAAWARGAGGVCCTNYFDDSGTLDFACSRASGQALLLCSYKCAGLSLDFNKRTPMAVQRHFLGVLLDLSAVQSQAEMRVCLKEGLAEDLSSEIRRILECDSLSSAEAAKLRGRLGWASCSMYGRCGRGGQAPLVQRQYASEPPALTAALRRSLEFYLSLLQLVQPRVIHLASLCRRPVVIYTDASWEPKCMQRPGLGYVLMHPDFSQCLGGASSVTEEILAVLSDRQTQIMPLEALAILQAFAAFCHLNLRCQDVVLFVDNQAVVSSLIKGACSEDDISLVLLCLHLFWAHLSCRVWLEWVPSDDNPADGLSRDGALDEWTTKQGWSLRTQPCLPWPALLRLDMTAVPSALEHWNATLDCSWTLDVKCHP